MSLHLTGVQIVLENSANISLHSPPTPAIPIPPCPRPVSLSLCLSLPVSSIEKVKSRTIGIRLSISVFAGLSNRKRQAADWVLCQQIGKQAGCGRRGAPPRPRDGCNTALRAQSPDEVSTDKVRGLMDGQSRQLDVRMDEGRGGI